MLGPSLCPVVPSCSSAFVRIARVSTVPGIAITAVSFADKFVAFTTSQGSESLLHGFAPDRMIDHLFLSPVTFFDLEQQSRLIPASAFASSGIAASISVSNTCLYLA